VADRGGMGVFASGRVVGDLLWCGVVECLLIHGARFGEFDARSRLSRVGIFARR